MHHIRFAIVLLILPAWGCGIVGPSCTAQRKEGAVTTISGEVAAGAISSHVVDYGTEGSQNNVSILWPGQRDPDGPRLTVFATKVDCVDFQPSSGGSGGSCETLGIAGYYEGHMSSSLTVTHGQGNPERLGSPPRFKLWVIGDPSRMTSYSMTVTWFRGPDC